MVTYRYLYYLFLVILFSACARQMNPDVERGSDYSFREGYPDVRVSALGFLDLQDNAVIDVTTDIVYGSLVFREIDDSQKAQVELAIRVVNRDTGATENILQEFEIDSERELFLLSEELFSYTERVEVEPGQFTIVVSVLDKNTGREIMRETEAYIPDPAEDAINLTAVRLSGKNLDSANPLFAPITTYNISSNLDSLKFEFQVTNNQSDDPLTISAQLLRYEADLSPSAPMSDNNPSPSQIEYKGIDYRDYTIVDENIRRLEQAGSVLIEFKYGTLKNGNYRFEVETSDNSGNDLFKARDFAVRGGNFPTMQTPKELAEPLIYLMSRSEHNRLMEINNPDEMKEAIDRFWLTNIGSMREARDIINLFYERVETANKHFTNFKEGWKTDRGKMYILFGPPWYIESSGNELMWSYTHNRSDPVYNFMFERTRAPSEYYPFEHYLLNRRSEFHSLEYRQRQIWLTGAILRRDI